MHKRFLAVAVAVVGASLALSGCNGDDDGGPSPVPVPVGTATAGVTTAPTTPATQTLSAPVLLPNGQAGTLNLRASGTTVTGNVVVRAAGAAKMQNQTGGFTIAAGTYAVTGTFTPPRTFTVRGNFPAPVGAFTFRGTFPTATEAGNYTITVGGETTSGVFPIRGTTPTPSPTPTQPSGANGTLVFTAGAGYNGISGSLSDFGFLGFGAPQANGTLANGFFQGRLAATGTSVGRALALSTNNGFKPITQGLTIPIRPASNLADDAFSITYGEVPRGNPNGTRGWVANGGSVLFESITANRITLRFRNVTFTPAANTPLAKGTFTLTGSSTFAYQQ